MTLREKFIADQAHKIRNHFSLTSGEEDSRKRYETLAIDTYDALILAGRKSPDSIIRLDAARLFVSGGQLHSLLPPEIVERWQEWGNEYEDFLERNPKVMMYEMISDASYAHNLNSWPVNENVIRDWVDNGQLHALPLNGSEIVDGAFFDKLRALRKQCRGWLYYDDDTNQVVFRPDDLKNFV